MSFRVFLMQKEMHKSSRAMYSLVGTPTTHKSLSLSTIDNHQRSKDEDLTGATTATHRFSLLSPVSLESGQADENACSEN